MLSFFFSLIRIADIIYIMVLAISYNWNEFSKSVNYYPVNSSWCPPDTMPKWIIVANFGYSSNSVTFYSITRVKCENVTLLQMMKCQLINGIKISSSFMIRLWSIKNKRMKTLRTRGVTLGFGSAWKILNWKKSIKHKPGMR